MATNTWKAIAETAQKTLNEKIPAEWRLSEAFLDPNVKDVTGVPAKSGILTAQELEITAQDMTAILGKIHSGEWSSEQVTLAFCKRSAIAHQLVNCLTEICYDEALATAKALDAEFKATGKLKGPLHGIPVSIKDHVNVAGLRSTLGYSCWYDNIPAEDAVLVKALKAAGAVVFVKTTMPVTGMAIETVSQLWGRTRNGFNRALVAGGSSGGEGALVGLYGSPMGIGTDVGGSIRVPCAFNGLYGIRPSTRRLSYEGITSNVRGGRAIPAAIGPMCHSLRDVELLCQVATDAKPWLEDIGAVPVPWQRRPAINRKLSIGIMRFDGVVMPHPPVLRGLDEVVKKLEAAGHDVVQFAPYQHQRAWDIAYPLYYATGGKEMQQLLDKTGEPWPPAAAKLSANPELQELQARELYKLHAAQDDYKKEYIKYWNATAKQTKSGEPIDALLCPINPCASYPHDFLTWWGYASQWNLLDFPGVIVPVGFSDKNRDQKDSNYKPINDLDKENYDLYDAELWHNAPISVQLVGKPFEDERLLAVSAIVDDVVNK
ncbi:Amidase [Niveomyces insectorum RCEF 264]|uniref:amidase n=1 Tax=Niveomyces insectorum RCEF 264 TaxID=1081102 RepID=A0A167T8P4_9HYPO|nr:Amidase [Niveomyces insectorum RCEF 264]